MNQNISKVYWLVIHYCISHCFQTNVNALSLLLFSQTCDARFRAEWSWVKHVSAPEPKYVNHLISAAFSDMPQLITTSFLRRLCNSGYWRSKAAHLHQLVVGLRLVLDGYRWLHLSVKPILQQFFFLCKSFFGTLCESLIVRLCFLLQESWSWHPCTLLNAFHGSALTSLWHWQNYCPADFSSLYPFMAISLLFCLISLA